MCAAAASSTRSAFQIGPLETLQIESTTIKNRTQKKLKVSFGDAHYFTMKFESATLFNIDLHQIVEFEKNCAYAISIEKTRLKEERLSVICELESITKSYQFHLRSRSIYQLRSYNEIIL